MMTKPLEEREAHDSAASQGRAERACCKQPPGCRSTT